jgi:hypothetical protein
MDNLRHATIFRDDVLQWAKRTNVYALPELRGIVRDWWRENERFFKEKNYKAVKPGRDLPKTASLNGVPEEGGAATPASTPVPAPVPVMSGSPEVPAKHRNSRWMWIATTAFAVLLGGWRLLHRSRHES